MRNAIAFASLAAAAGPVLPVGDAAGFASSQVFYSTGARAICISGILPVPATSTTNIRFNYPIPANQSIVTQTFIDLITPGSNFPMSIAGPMSTVSGTYNISSQLCFPAGSTTKPTTIQFLTHGVGFDKAYWDFAPGYSYVDAAADAGYATFLYDRLSVGKSAKYDPVQVVQAPLQVEIAASLIKALRNGTIANTAFSKVVGVGHSYGSIITSGVAAKYPSYLDAAVLTGFSTDSTGQGAFLSALNVAVASENQPYRFNTLNNGYLVSSSAISNQIGFFRSPNFDPAILNLAEATKSTLTVGEFFSMRAVQLAAPGFKGPVEIVNGDQDLPFCFANCTAPSTGSTLNKAAAALKQLYPNVPTNLTATYLAPNTGHGLNLHYSALSAYAQVMNFLKSHGL